MMGFSALPVRERLPDPAGVEHALSETDRVRSLQAAWGLRPCFRTEARLHCATLTCAWRGECRRLIAQWKR